MESRITHFCLIIDFLDVDFESRKISEILKIEVDNILKNNSFVDQNDWIIQFSATYNNGKHLLVSKNKLGSYPNDKVKEITIPIPIPLKNKISWGVNKEQYVHEITHYDKLLKNFWILDIDYHQFTNRTEYIIDCMRRAIKKVFEEGFTVGGVKIKINI